MTTLLAKLRNVVGALMLIAAAVSWQPAAAQQPNSVDPNASAVSEQQLLQQLQDDPGSRQHPRYANPTRSSSRRDTSGAISTR